MVEEDLRKRVAELEEALATSRAQLTTIVESLPFDFWIIDETGRYSAQNATSKKHWGTDAVGRTPDDVAPDESVREVWRKNNARAFAGEIVVGAVDYVHDGETRHYLNILAPVTDRGVVRGILGVNIDVTDSKRLSVQIEKNQRLESLGMLAGGIAHDFNNLLMAIMGNIAVAARSLPPGSRSGPLLDEAERACLDARNLTRQLLTFARGGQPVRAVIKLRDLIEDSVRFALRGTASRPVFDLDRGSWAADVDPGQLQQVLQNLAINASQAMPEGGEIHVTADNVVVAPNLLELKAGRYVKVTVRDVGAGIPERALPRIFEPYFTTKPHGQGLGLAVVYSILKRHGGTVVARSRTGEGTTMDVYVPAAEGDGAAPVTPRMPPAWRGQGRVLVVDDEPKVRAAIGAMLSLLGFEPRAVASTGEAEQAFEADAPFRAAIIDLTIPGDPGGVACLEKLRERDPRLVAIVASGYSRDPVLSDPGAYGFRGRLTKPFGVADLAAALKDALEGAPDEANIDA